VKPAVQLAGIALWASAAAVLVASVVGAVATAIGICDPKFGCTFGVQFGALVSGVVGFLLGLLLLCSFAAYGSFTQRTVPIGITWRVAAAVGALAGAALSIGGLVSYA
jgi:hypothetical protein